MPIKLTSTGNNIHISGYTFPIINIIKEYGFSYEPKKKRWTKNYFDPDVYHELEGILIDFKYGKRRMKRPKVPDQLRCKGICKNGKRCSLKKRKDGYCKIHQLKIKDRVDFI